MTRRVHIWPRCSYWARTPVSATHIRSGALVPGAPLISHSPPLVTASAAGRWAAPNVTTATAAATERIDLRFKPSPNHDLTQISKALDSGNSLRDVAWREGET